jgi:FAD/FMN-containing dehydrogenase
VFSEIYKVIRADKHNIVGGGGSVGIGGWMMEGGYSLKTNQYGLVLDNPVQVQIVLPNSGETVVTANEGNQSDSFWAIKVYPRLDQ